MLYFTSSYSMNASMRRTLGLLQTDLSRSQKELATGRHADPGLALGVRSGRSFSLREASETIEAIRATNNLAAARLEATQGGLGNLHSSAREIRATLLAAQTDGGEPAAIVTQARNALTTFIATLNGADGDSFLFAGTNSAAPPIVNYFAEPQEANKRALDAAFRNAFGFSQSDPAIGSITADEMERFLAEPFAALFDQDSWKADWSRASDAPLENRISVSQKIETSITANEPPLRKLAAALTMVADLGAARMNADAYRTVLREATQMIDGAIDLLTITQARAGVMQRSIKVANENMSVQLDVLRTQTRDLEGVDQTEAAARVNELMTQIETSFTLTARISRLSLVNYL